MTPISPSEIFIKAMGITPSQKLEEAAPGQRCRACAHELHGVGVKKSLPPTFFSSNYFKAPASNLFCIYCASLIGDGSFDNAQISPGVVSSEGYKKFSKHVDAASFILKPPSPPFAVATKSTSMKQHFWWMAATSYDPDRFIFSMGARKFPINRLMVIDLAEKIVRCETSDEGKKAKLSVFHKLDDQLKSNKDALPTPNFMKQTSDDAQAIKSLLPRINLGELWFAMRLRKILISHKVNSVTDLPKNLEE